MMKTSILFKLLLISCFTLWPLTDAASQSIFLPDPTPQEKMAAKAEVQKWEDELSLTAKETMLMEKKIIEYNLKRKRLMQANLHPHDRLKMLARLRLLEIGDMQNILTRPQYERYVYLLEQEALQEELPEAGLEDIAER